MSDIRSDAFNFLEKSVIRKTQDIQIQAEPANAFKTIFNIQSLDHTDSDLIEKLILENCDVEEEAQEVTRQIQQITIEVRGILKEGALLLGERIYKAREILKRHNKNKNSFTEWLKIAFSNSRSTAYNALSYYEFHSLLPSDHLKDLFRKCPHKAAYILSAREGGIAQKIDILRKHSHLKSEEIIDIIDEELPLPHSDQRKRQDNDLLLINKIRGCLHRLEKHKSHFSHEVRVQMSELREFINSILI
jgi:hypothetical protein